MLLNTFELGEHVMLKRNRDKNFSSKELELITYVVIGYHNGLVIIQNTESKRYLIDEDELYSIKEWKVEKL